jgi:hypothetical protein
VRAAEISALALRVPCGFCWAPLGTACAEEGQHLARYLGAHRRGLIGRDVVRTICLALPRISAGQVVADAAAPADGAPGNDPQRAAAVLRE